MERMVDNMELSKGIEELLEEYDFSLCGEIEEQQHEKGVYDVELETWSPEGENVIVSLTYDGTEEGFVAAFDAYAECFDIDEHVELWIGSRGKDGVPESIKDLLEDAKWIKNTLMDTAYALNYYEEESAENTEEEDKSYDLGRNEN